MPTEEQLLEMHRLTVLRGESRIAQDVANGLAGAWLRLFRFQDVKDLCMKTQEVGRDRNILIFLDQAKSALGEVDDTLTLYVELRH